MPVKFDSFSSVRKPVGISNGVRVAEQADGHTSVPTAGQTVGSRTQMEKWVRKARRKGRAGMIFYLGFCGLKAVEMRLQTVQLLKVCPDETAHVSEVCIHDTHYLKPGFGLLNDGPFPVVSPVKRRF